MRYFIKKTAALLVTLLVAAFLTFLAFEVIPSDAAEAALGMDATEEEVEALREQLGLNRPLLVRYGHFCWVRCAVISASLPSTGCR